MNIDFKKIPNLEYKSKTYYELQEIAFKINEASSKGLQSYTTKWFFQPDESYCKIYDNVRTKAIVMKEDVNPVKEILIGLGFKVDVRESSDQPSILFTVDWKNVKFFNV